MLTCFLVEVQQVSLAGYERVCLFGHWNDTPRVTLALCAYITTVEAIVVAEHLAAIVVVVTT